MNTIMHTESFHHVLKIVYLKQKVNRCFDKLLYIFLKIASVLNKTDTEICGICFCEDDQNFRLNKSIGCHAHYVHCGCTRTVLVLKT